MNEDQMIRRDRMRFRKNKMSSNLAILAIVFDVFYFVSIYQSDKGNYYYTYMIGISVIYNLIFMLAAFLSAEGVKSYKKNYSYLLALLGVGQIVRIFMQAHTYVDAAAGLTEPPMGNGQFTYLVALLVLSAVCLVAAGVVNYIKCVTLEAHLKYLEEQSAQGAGSLAAKSV